VHSLLVGGACRCIVTTCVLVGALADVESAQGSHVPGQRVVARVTAESLPDPLNRYFSQRKDGLIERALEPDAVWPQERRYRAREQWHFLMIDAAADDDSIDARLAAARNFPSDRRDAKRLLRDRGAGRGGSLIWELADLTEQLSEAFADRDEARILQYAGYVIHFSTDAADPFCCTRDPQGMESGNLVLTSALPGEALFADQDVGHRIGWELIRRNAQRYTEALQASRRRALSIEAPAENVLGVMQSSLGDLKPLCEADAGLLASMRIADSDTFSARRDEYYMQLDTRCGDAVVDSLSRAVDLASGLILHAWIDAGSPDPTASRAPPASSVGGTRSAGGSRATATPAPSASSSGYVASKNSKVYHHPDCGHAKRISPGNVVHFPDKSSAEDSGRRGCKTCRP